MTAPHRSHATLQMRVAAMHVALFAAVFASEANTPIPSRAHKV